MTTAFPFMMPLGSESDADALEMWTKPGKEAFQFWISFFPTAPLFGVEWRFANMVDPAMNPFMAAGMMPGLMPGMPGMPGLRAAAIASHPGELDSPATADEDAAKPVARAAETAGRAATDMTRLAGEGAKAAARTADGVMKGGAEAVKAAVDGQARALDLAEEAGKAAGRATETAMTAVEDTATAVGIAAEEMADATGKAARRGTEAAGKAGEEAAKAAGTAAKKGAETANEMADAVDHAIAAAPKPKMLLDKRPKETDDLKGIKGIGPDLERQLNSLGLYRFDQLAKMTDADLAWIDANITRFKGRCFRDDWVGQAKSRLSK